METISLLSAFPMPRNDMFIQNKTPIIDNTPPVILKIFHSKELLGLFFKFSEPERPCEVIQ